MKELHKWNRSNLYLTRRAVSVHPSVRLSHTGIVSKRLNLNFFDHLVDYHSSFFDSGRRYPTGTPLPGTQNTRWWEN